MNDLEDQVHESDTVLCVSILGREYPIKCSKDRVEDLQTLASQLDKKMKDIQSRGHVGSTDRVAVMAALQMAYDLLLQLRKQQTSMAHMEQTVATVHHAVTSALIDQEPELQL